ncbi:DEKNAAC102718 [Brettanomyces naardenensis]|uniref:DEKNAAC102718 n=1 Tax=Brettanomyces naardenensis TaxID=13370 RepID=A0A448YKU9_BRENA|nr:DEKNAAC102718 [Brettanomyces naardenensis]
MSDPTDIILQERGRDAKSRDDLLLTPNQIPASPFITPYQSGESSVNLTPSATDTVMKIKAQDADHQRRFERFLNFCGIEKKLIRRTHSTPPPNRGADEVSEVSDTGLEGDASVHVISVDSTDSVEYHSTYDDGLPDIASRDINPFVQCDEDQFYSTYHHVFCRETGGEYGEDPSNGDSDDSLNGQKIQPFTRDDYGSSLYILGGGYSEISTIGKKFPETLGRNLTESGVPTNSNDTFANYESHSSKLNVNLVPTTRVSEDLDSAVKIQPAAKFPDPLEIKFHPLHRMSFGSGRKFKNNIVACSQEHDLIFVAANSAVEVFDPIHLSEGKTWDPVLEFETRPSVTTDEQRANSTWPYYPHTINYVMVSQFCGQEVLAVASDDGRVLMYYTKSLVEEIIRSVSRTKSLRQVYTIDPDFELGVKSSAWGVDIDDNKVVVSDNSQRITLFYYDEQSGRFFSVLTHQLMHNIPSVSFIRDEPDVYVSASCISGELLVFKFPFTMSLDSAGSKTVRFLKPKVISRAILNEGVWSTCYVDGKYFKKVSSLQLMTGDPWVDHDNVVINRILNESFILDAESDECRSSHLGFAAELQNFFIPTLSFNHPYYSRSYRALTTDTDRFRRMSKIFDDYYVDKQRARTKSYGARNMKEYWEPVASSERFKDKFLVVSAKLQVGLFRVNRLLYNASISNLFEYKAPNEDSSYSNRLSLSLVIPELSCYVVASQVGLVSIFRLTECRGVHGMRQEYVIPNYRRLSRSGTFGIRTLIGITCRCVDCNRYILYLVYIDGLIMAYSLTSRRPISSDTLGYL